MITILTPTFNRASLLPILYSSLLSQKEKNFEWIVVDDGSADGTDEMVLSWKNKTKDFPIILIHQENGGKHRAINNGIKKASGDFVLIVDSDDYLTDNATEFISQHLEEVSDIGFAGLACLRGDSITGETLNGQREDGTFVDATNIEREHLGLGGDLAEIYKTSVLKAFPFPEFEGERFLNEACVWDKIALSGYRIRFYRTVIYKGTYLDGGLTQSSSDERFAENYQGYTYFIRQLLSYKPLTEQILKIGDYKRISKIKGLKRKQICRNLGIPLWKYDLSSFLFFNRLLLRPLKGVFFR